MATTKLLRNAINTMIPNIGIYIRMLYQFYDTNNIDYIYRKVYIVYANNRMHNHKSM